MSGFLVLCISWLVPLHFLPWVSWHGELVAFVAAALLLVPVLIQVHKRQRTFSAPSTFDVLLAVGLIALLQTAAGMIVYSGDMLILGLYLSLCIAAAIRGYADGVDSLKPINSSRHPLDACAWSLAIAALLSSAIALTQVLDVWEHISAIVRMPWARRAGGNLAQPNHLGSLLLLGMASMLYLQERKFLSYPTLLVGVSFIEIAIASTESRTALLGILALGTWTIVGSIRHTLEISRIFLISIIALGCGLFLMWPALMSYFDFFEAGAKINTHAGTRLIVWAQLLEAIQQKPWVGWGLRQVSVAHNAVASGYTVSEPFSYAHNILIEMVLGVGLPLTFLFCIILLRWVWCNIQSNSSLSQWYCVQILIILGIHSMLEFPYAYAYFLVPAFYAAGMLDSIQAKASRISISSTWFFSAAALVFSIGIWSIPEYLSAEDDSRVARFEALHIGTRPIGYKPPQIHLLDQLTGLLAATRATPAPFMSPNDIDTLRKAAIRYPWLMTQHRYALALALNGSPEEAIRQLKVIRAMHGEKVYAGIKTSWAELAHTKYPQLEALELP